MIDAVVSTMQSNTVVVYPTSNNKNTVEIPKGIPIV